MASPMMLTTTGFEIPQDPPSDYSQRFSPQLVKRALSGESRLLEELIDTLTPVIRARIRRRLQRNNATIRFGDSGWDVEDLTQDTFAYLFERDARVLRTWAPERGLSLANFVGLIAERMVAARLRTKCRSSELAVDEQTVEGLTKQLPLAPAQVEARDDLANLVDRMRSRLSVLGMRLFWLLFLEEYTTDEVQQSTGLSHDAIYAWRSRIRKRMA